MTDDVQLDLDRATRTGIPEAVLVEPKTGEQLVRVLDQAAAHGAAMLLTRMSPAQFAALPTRLQSNVQYDPESGTGYFGAAAPALGEARVAVVCAGTSDRPVAAEAERTLRFAGHEVLSVADVGVAGLWRLNERLTELHAMRVIIVVAGMEGALATVLAGLVPSVIIAVPTSVGYGGAAGGQAALNSALASCAPGVVVVNIDNGYGAASAAIRALG